MNLGMESIRYIGRIILVKNAEYLPITKIVAKENIQKLCGYLCGGGIAFILLTVIFLSPGR